jgi:hypothetical protein
LTVFCTLAAQPPSWLTLTTTFAAKPQRLAPITHGLAGAEADDGRLSAAGAGNRLVLRRFSGLSAPLEKPAGKFMGNL